MSSPECPKNVIAPTLICMPRVYSPHAQDLRIYVVDKALESKKNIWVDMKDTRWVAVKIYKTAAATVVQDYSFATIIS